MPSGEHIENRLKTLAMVIIFGIFAFYVPLRLAVSEKHPSLAVLEAFRLLGPVLVALGVIGYIMSIWRFIAEAAASPMLGDSGKIITSGIYRYTRNPIYLSGWLVLFGEALFFTSLPNTSARPDSSRSRRESRQWPAPSATSTSAAP